MHTCFATGASGRFHLHDAVVRPAAALLAHRSDCRIFQQQSVPAIVTRVLNQAGCWKNPWSGACRPPYALPAHKTRSTIKSDTRPGGNGANEMGMWLTLLFTLIGLVPTFGSLIKGVLKLIVKGARLDKVLSLFNHFIKGNGIGWLKQLKDGQLQEHIADAGQAAHTIFAAVIDKLQALKRYMPQRLKALRRNTGETIADLQRAKAMTDEKFAALGDRLQEKLGRLLAHRSDDLQHGSVRTVARKQQRTQPPGNLDDALPKDYDPLSGGAGPKMTPIKKKFDDLKAQGHGPQRHEGDVTTKDLEDRCTKGIDPMTGTTTDGAHGGKHRYGRSATKVNTPEGDVKAEEQIKNSNEFNDKVKSADMSGKKQKEFEDANPWKKVMT